MQAISIFPDELRDRLPDYFSRVVSGVKLQGSKTIGTCPRCGGIGHLSLFDCSGRMIAHCYKCGLNADIYGLCALCEGVSALEASRRIKHYYGWGGAPAVWGTAPLATHPTAERAEHHANYKDYIKRCAEALPNSAGEAYLRGRGFTLAIMRRFALGYDAAHNSVVFPYNRACSYYMRRSLTGKQFYKPSFEQAGREPVYNASAIRNGQRYIMACESQIDAISLAQCGAYAVAVGGTGASKLLRLIRDTGITGLCIGLCFDADTAGDAATDSVTSAATSLAGVSCVDCRDVLAGYKDANERLQSDAEGLYSAVQAGIQLLMGYKA